MMLFGQMLKVAALATPGMQFVAKAIGDVIAKDTIRGDLFGIVKLIDRRFIGKRRKQIADLLNFDRIRFGDRHLAIDQQPCPPAFRFGIPHTHQDKRLMHKPLLIDFQTAEIDRRFVIEVQKPDPHLSRRLFAHSSQSAQ